MMALRVTICLSCAQTRVKHNAALLPAAQQPAALPGRLCCCKRHHPRRVGGPLAAPICLSLHRGSQARCMFKSQGSPALQQDNATLICGSAAWRTWPRHLRALAGVEAEPRHEHWLLCSTLLFVLFSLNPKTALPCPAALTPQGWLQSSSCARSAVQPALHISLHIFNLKQ